MSNRRLLRALNELTSARDVSTVTRITSSVARELTDADGVSIVLREGDYCFYADEEAIAPLWKGRRFPLESCVSGWAMLHGVPVVLPDVYEDIRVPHGAYRPTFVRSLAMVPVGAPEPVAAIGAYWAATHQATPDEIEVLSALADGTGLALTNVKLFEELRTSLAREREARMLAERAIAAKDEFLALVAHELRQPLHAALAALHLMKSRVGRDAGQRARDVIERQVTHMNRLVGDLVDAARIVRGHVHLSLRPLDLRETVRRVVDAIGPVIIERCHTLGVHVPEEPVPVQADDMRLQQVLMNLLTNAAKYTQPGGRISVSLEPDTHELSVTVADNGRGIDPAKLPAIFDLFTRADGDTAGFGVGLAVARKLVELHGGRIEARSAGVGRGSEFVVYLPMASGLAGRAGEDLDRGERGG